MAKIPPGEASILTFTGTRILAFGRALPESGWVNFACELSSRVETALEKLGPSLLDVELRGGEGSSMQMTPEQPLGILATKSPDDSYSLDTQFDIEFETLTQFTCAPLETQGRRRMGFRRELRFSARFACRDGAANLEHYMVRTRNARGKLQVTYRRPAVQTEFASEETKYAVQVTQ